MAFQSVSEFYDERYRGMFRLVNDEDTADVIFLYRSKLDELKVDAHYIKSSGYTGYVHCCGKGCPACAKGIRVQTKIFVPIYNIKQNDTVKDQIEFWDRQIGFDKQLDSEVFKTYPNPAEVVFKVTRHGEAGSKDTRYSIQAKYRNTIASYEDILAKFNATMPDYYSNVIKEFSIPELADLLQTVGDSSPDLPDYTPIPRAGYQPSIPDTFVDATTAVSTPASVSSDIADVVEAAADDEEFPDPEF